MSEFSVFHLSNRNIYLLIRHLLFSLYLDFLSAGDKTKKPAIYCKESVESESGQHRKITTSSFSFFLLVFLDCPSCATFVRVGECETTRQRQLHQRRQRWLDMCPEFQRIFLPISVKFVISKVLDFSETAHFVCISNEKFNLSQ